MATITSHGAAIPFPRTLKAALALSLLFATAPVAAADEGIMARGDAAVTAFSGVAEPASPPSDVNKLDVTLIDPDKPSLQIFDLSHLGGAPTGQLANAPSKHKVSAGEIGQVFGIALDSATASYPPSIYVGATSLFGLNIVETDDKGRTIRLVKGAPAAEWMNAQWGKDGGPGSIWKIDGKTGAVSLFTTVTSGDRENAGPGLGGLAFDPASNSLYVSNLETGMIHRLDLSGREIDTFDHGVTARASAGLEIIADDATRRMDIHAPEFSSEDPETWGFALAKRRVVALAIETGRLYYSVAEGPVVWSVGLNQDGSFASDARFEIDVVGTPSGNMVTSIAFDGPDQMYLSQRGGTAGSYDYATLARPQESVVYRYTRDTGTGAWKESPEEFPIGLEPPHRATNGGIAFNYGYDDKGDIDYGRCHETLWTTGEHLRNGEDAARVDTGGARTVHGLQGNYKTLAQPVTSAAPQSGAAALRGAEGGFASPLNEPWETWFSDNDGTFDEDKAHGHVGAVAIYEPCEKEASAEPARPEPPVEPAPGGPVRPIPGIYIDKECAPAPIGGVVTCTITVTNTGIVPFGDVQFTDVSSMLFGPTAGAPVPAATITPDGPDWICTTPAGSPAVSCLLPGGSLLPGQSRSVTVTVDTGPIVASGNMGFRNCASLAAPYNDEVCVDSGANITVMKSGPAQCNPGTDCTFQVQVTNSGTSPFNGNVRIADAMFIGGAVAPAPITGSDLNCIGGNPAALPFDCVEAVSLAPGETLTHSITVTMPPAPPANYWAQNCFAAADPSAMAAGAVPQPNAGQPVGANGVPACVWVAAGNPPPMSNLAITKSPIGATCTKVGFNTASCTYQVRIQNTGPSPFNGPVSFTETPPPGAGLIADPGWTCGPAGPGFQCTSNANVPLAPLDSVTLNVTVNIPAPLTEPTCTVPNTVNLTVPPPGSPANTFAGDDTGAATHNTSLLAFRDAAGVLQVMCDPTNLATKKAAETCVKSGDSYKCNYKVTVTNTGPDPYDGPVHIEDQLGAAATDASFSGDWTCSGSGANHLCTKPVVLAPGESVELEATATVPDNGTCSLENTARMTFPLPGSRYNRSGGDDVSSASATVPSEKCKERPRCDAPAEGEFQTASGSCACKEGYTRDSNGQCVGGEPIEPQPPEETTPTPETCPNGEPIPRNGRCPCERDEVWNGETGRCEAPCEPGENEYRNSKGQCLCKTGYARDEDYRCVAVDTGPQRPSCTPGPNEYYDHKQDQCRCRRGYDRDNHNRCVLISEGPDEPIGVVPVYCSPDEYRAAPGICCALDEVLLGNRCVRVTTPPPPPCVLGPNEYRLSRTQCVCLPYYSRNRNGVCAPDDNIRPCAHGQYVAAPGVCCDIDEVFLDGKCRSRTKTCPDGSKVPIGMSCRTQCGHNEYRAAPGICCKIGEVYRNGKCMSREGGECHRGDRKCECIAGGGRWNARTETCNDEGMKTCPNGSVVPAGKACPGGPTACLADDTRCKCKLRGLAYNEKTGRCEGEDGNCRPGDNRCKCEKTGGNWKRGECVREGGGSQSCPNPRQIRGDDGKCYCRPGDEFCSGGGADSDTCKKGDNRCKCERSGGTWSKGRCKPSSSEQTPAEVCRKQGGTWKNGKCETTSTPSPAEICRKQGGTWRNGKCETTSTPSPAEVCRKQGGTWKNGKCETTSTPSPAEVCRKQGGTWKNGKCETASTPSPAEVCRKQGGTWKNGKCETASTPSPAELCRKQGGTWKKGKCRTGNAGDKTEPEKSCPSGTTGKYPNCKPKKEGGTADKVKKQLEKRKEKEQQKQQPDQSKQQKQQQKLLNQLKRQKALQEGKPCKNGKTRNPTTGKCN